MTIFGIDVSHYDTVMSWPAVRASGIDFVTVKVTEGVTYNDTEAGKHLSGARAAGIPVLGGYHVLHPTNAVAQADHYLARLNAVVPWWKTVPWIHQCDAEIWDDGKPSLGAVWTWCDRVTSKAEHGGVVVYASKGQYEDELTGLPYPLWNAAYGTNPSAGLSAYPGDSSSRWNAYSGQVPRLLQFGSRILAGGHRGDASAFIGTFAQLLQLAGVTEGIFMSLTDAQQETMYKMIAEMERIISANATSVAPAGFYQPGTWTATGVAPANQGSDIPLPDSEGWVSRVPSAARVLLDAIHALQIPVTLSSDDRTAIVSAVTAEVGARIADLDAKLTRLMAALGSLDD